MNMDDTIYEFDDGWRVLQEGIANFLLGHHSQGMKYKFNVNEFVELYTTCYNMCSQHSPFNWSAELYVKYKEVIQTYLQDTVRPTLLLDLLQERVTDDDQKMIVVNEIVNCWSNHLHMTKNLRRIFHNLDQYYVKLHSLPTLAMASYQLFKTEIYLRFKDNITKSALPLVFKVLRDDGEEVVDDDNAENNSTRALIRRIINMYKCMGMEVYISDFETPLLEMIRKEYQEKRKRWLKIFSIPEYLIMVNEAMAEEQMFVTKYSPYPTSSVPRFHAIVEEELICVGFVMLLSQNRIF